MGKVWLGEKGGWVWDRSTHMVWSLDLEVNGGRSIPRRRGGRLGGIRSPCHYVYHPALPHTVTN